MSAVPEPTAVDAVVVPRPAATVMLLRDGTDGLEVLLLRRASSTPFVPGAHVFPGGAVDDADVEPSGPDGVVVGRAAADVDRLLGVDAGGTGFFLTAVRECLEEAGIVLAREADDRPVRPDHPIFDDLPRLRPALEAGTRTLVDVYREHGLRVPLDELAYVARWITPEPSPRRYDARFFAAAMPEGQRAGADGWEAVDAGWWRPADALSDWQAGRIDIIEPTVASLELLATYPSAGAAMEALHAGVTVEGAQG
ncbi:MAG: NUDIX hydrolase [Acidimicrobiia bacterium]